MSDKAAPPSVILPETDLITELSDAMADYCHEGQSLYRALINAMNETGIGLNRKSWQQGVGE